MNFQGEITEKIKVADKITEIFNKLKNDKKALLIIAVGLLGMILIMFSGEKDDVKTGKNTDINESSFCNNEQIKKELKDLIESINGAGEAKVMITYKSDKETVFAADTEDILREDETKTKKEYVIIKNNSDESGLPLKIIYPEVKGVAVVCEGGDNQIVKEKIYSLVCALFSISSNSVSVASLA